MEPDFKYCQLETVLFLLHDLLIYLIGHLGHVTWDYLILTTHSSCMFFTVLCLIFI